MLRTHAAISLICLLLMPGIAVLAQEPVSRVAPAEVGLSQEGLTRVTHLLNRFVDEGKIAGAVAGVARRGQLAYLESVGYQNLQTRTPMTETSLFRIYSMTRTVTAVAIMVLHEEGRLNVNDPVSRYLPEFEEVRVSDPDGGRLRPPSRPVAIRDLLLHTSGLNFRNSAPYREAQVRSRSIPLSGFIENVVAVPLMEDPGTRFRYGVSSTVLGAVVEAASGQRFDEFLQDRVLGPLGMTETVFWAGPGRSDRLTTVYRQADNGDLVPYQIEEVPFTVRPELLEGAVGLLSTVPDFVSLSQMLLNGGELADERILEEGTVASLISNGLSDAVLATRRGGMGWGLANVSVVLDPSSMGYPTSLGEYGWDGSAGTIFWVNPAEELVIVLMWQSAPANPESLRQQVKALVHEAIIN